MSSPAAVVALSYDGSDLQIEDLSIFLEIAHGLNEPPQVRGSDTVVPALAGRVEGNRVNDVLPIELVGLVSPSADATTRAEQLASFRTNALAVRALFATDRAVADLVATLEDGTVVAISARPMNAIWNERPIFATVSIELEGYDDWAVVDGS